MSRFNIIILLLEILWIYCLVCGRRVSLSLSLSPFLPLSHSCILTMAKEVFTQLFKA